MLREILPSKERLSRYVIDNLMRKRLIQMCRSQKQKGRHFCEGFILEITDEGREYYLDEFGPLPAPGTNLVKEHTDDFGVLNKNFPHSLGLCDVRISFDYGAQQLGWQVRSIAEIIEHHKIDFTKTPTRATWLDMPSQFKMGEQIVQKAVRPDNLAAIIETSSNRALYVFEEYERSTPASRGVSTDTAFERKIMQYEHIANTGLYRQYFPFLKGFTVLFYFTSPGRMQKPLKIIEEVVGDKYTMVGGKKHYHAERYLVNFIKAKRRDAFATVPLKPELATGEWYRGGLPPIRLTDILG